MSPTQAPGNLASRKPGPLFPQRVRKLCPVCGATSYSVQGVHPQCEMRRRDDLHRERRKAAKR